MSEVATYLKVGTTSIVLAMIEDDVIGDDLALANPVGAIRQISHDPTLHRTILLRCGPAGHRAGDRSGRSSSGPRSTSVSTGSSASASEVGADVLRRWEAVLDRARSRSRARRDVVDWVAKQRLVDGYRRAARPAARRRPAEGARPAVPRPARRTSAWPVGSGSQTLVDARRGAAGDDRTADHHPRRTSVAGACRSGRSDIVAANWDSLVFDIGRDPLRRVPMMEPLRGTADHVARLIDECDTAAELLVRLGS